MTSAVNNQGARADGAVPLTLFEATPPSANPPRPAVRAPRVAGRGARGPTLSLGWRCGGCTAEVVVEGALCEGCQERRHARAELLWKVDIALRIELGDDVLESLWHENEGDDPEEAIAARAASADAAAMSDRAYEAWCELYWRAWRLRRRWSGLPPELPLERWVEMWFFDQPVEQFDPDCDVEIIGYPARPVVDVATGSYL